MKERISTLLDTGKQIFSHEISPRLQPLLAPFSAWHLRIMAVGAILILIGLFLPGPAQEPDITLRHVDPPATLGAQSDTQGTWHTYHVAAGETLAQLFRDEGLDTEALYAMAAIQGSSQPLGTLSAGQAVKVRMTSKSNITGLTLENTQGQVLFVRQADGKFLRVQ